MIRLIQFLADEGAVWGGAGLMAGQVITTGSWTGMLFAGHRRARAGEVPPAWGEVSLVFTS